MKAVIQRVKKSSVTVNGEVTGSIEKGYLVLLGVMDGDTEAEADLMAQKLTKLRVFSDEEGKMNRSVMDVNGGILVVSQFTLSSLQGRNVLRIGLLASTIEAFLPTHVNS